MNRNMRIPLQIVVPVLVVVAAVFGTRWLIMNRVDAKPEDRPAYFPTVEFQVVERLDQAVPVASRGAVRPRTTAILTAGVMGQVLAVSPELTDGRAVAAGTVLVTIDDAPFRAALAAIRSTIAQTGRLIAEEQARATQAERDWQRLGKGTPDPLVLRRPQLDALAAQLEAARVQEASAQRDLERCVLTAPFAGRITGKAVELGQQVALGMTLARLEATDAVEVILPVDLREVQHLVLPLRGEEIADGPTVTLFAPMGAVEATWSGRVVRTLADLETATRMLQLVCRVDAPLSADPPLLPGMFVEATIAGHHRDDLVRLPSGSLRQGGSLFVVDAESKLRQRQVTVIARHGGTVLVAGDLIDGERVLTTVLSEAHEGMLVRVAGQPAVPTGK